MFTVVSDPPEDEEEEGDCMDVAYASVDFLQVSNLPSLLFLCFCWCTKILWELNILKEKIASYVKRFTA